MNNFDGNELGRAAKSNYARVFVCVCALVSKVLLYASDGEFLAGRHKYENKKTSNIEVNISAHSTVLTRFKCLKIAFTPFSSPRALCSEYLSAR